MSGKIDNVIGDNGALYTLTEPVATTPFTISVWFKVPNITVSYIPVAIDTPEVAGYQILGTLEVSGAVGGDPVRAYNYNGSAFGVAATSSGYSADTWTHACGTFTNATLRAVFIDGGSKGTDTDNIVGTPSELVIGRRRRNATVAQMPANSFVAEIAVWDAALSDANVAMLAGGSNPLTVDGGNLIAYWPLTTVTTNEDQVGSNDLSTTGGVTYDADHPTVDPSVTYSELSGTIAAQSTMSGDLELKIYSALSGTIAAVSTVGPSSLGSETVGLDVAAAYVKRLVTMGSNQFWYEDI